MFTEMTKRTYTPRRRAEKQQETRQRIVEAAMALHGEVGPRDTTISAIAERAGVQRLTVYRHFPDDGSLFAACTGHWLALNPPPDPAAWAGIADPADRARAALGMLYGYYRRTAGMWRGSWRDREAVPALEQPMAEVDRYLVGIADGLTAAWGTSGKGKRALTALARHAVRFSTWESLAGAPAGALNDDQAADLMATAMAAVEAST